MSSIPRIGIVIGQLSYGGAERQTVELAVGMQQAGLCVARVFCLSTATEPNGRLLSTQGIEWCAPPKNRRPGISKLVWLVGQLKAKPCDLIYGVLHVGNIYGGLAATFLKRPFVASIRTARAPSSFWIRILSGLAFHRAANVIANSTAAAQSLGCYLGVRSRKVVVIANSVRLIERSHRSRELVRSELRIPMDGVVIGTVANLKEAKRPLFFLKVCRYVDELWKSQFPDRANALHFVWVGEGSERRLVSAGLAETLPELASRIRFPGARTAVARYLSAFDVFVLTSAHEGMPNALLEAMAAGLPCVATNVAGTCDVLAAGCQTGILANHDKPVEFAKTLCQLLCDASRMEKMGRNARRHVQEFHSRERMARSYCEVFLSVLKRNAIRK